MSADAHESDVTGARHECGIFGVHAPGEDAATYCYFGLYALQHRGQESAGIATSTGEGVLVTKEMGLVHQVFTPPRLAGMAGHLGIGHVRYSTTGASSWEGAQPAFKVTGAGASIALAHNGNLVNTAALTRQLGPAGDKCATDSELIATMLAEAATGRGIAQPLADVCSQLQGGFSLVVLDEHGVYAARDRNGVWPLVLGRLPTGGTVVASETTALDILGAHTVREVEPGEVVSIDDRGLTSLRWAEPDPKKCIFEYVYLARPDHRTGEGSIASARRKMGAALAEEAPIDADLVIPVPDSATSAAAGYAAASGIDYADGLVKNRYVGRTFIQPSQQLRQLGIRLKLNPLRDVLEGQRLVVVDDSIVRGNTSRQLVRMLREAGATEVHLRITSPPIRNPCYYGIDMATRAELIAAGLSVDEIRDFVGADSLAYLSLDALVASTGRPKGALCRSCMDGVYPIPVPAESDGADGALFTLPLQEVSQR